MSKIYTIGESAYDILFKDGQPINGKVGGSVINTSLSLGRLKCDINLIGDIAEDEIGKITLDFLSKNNVHTEYFISNPTIQSRISLAFLDDPNHPHYLFYKSNSKEKFQLNFPEPQRADIILFSSIYSIKPDFHSQIIHFLEESRKQKAILFYDPNFRKNHRSSLDELLPNIKKNCEISDIIKGSNEDFEFSFGYKSLKQVAENIDSTKEKVIIYTQGKESVLASVFGDILEIEVDEVQTKSAVGAGDSYNAAVVWELNKLGLDNQTFKHLEIKEWTRILKTANKFAAHVCTRDENYISLEFAKECSTKYK